jgi:hypothetical protein
VRRQVPAAWPQEPQQTDTNTTFIAVITQFPIMIAAKYVTLTRSLNGSYVIAHEQESNILFQTIVSIL